MLSTTMYMYMYMYVCMYIYIYIYIHMRTKPIRGARICATASPGPRSHWWGAFLYQGGVHRFGVRTLLGPCPKTCRFHGSGRSLPPRTFTGDAWKRMFCSQYARRVGTHEGAHCVNNCYYTIKCLQPLNMVSQHTSLCNKRLPDGSPVFIRDLQTGAWILESLQRFSAVSNVRHPSGTRTSPNPRHKSSSSSSSSSSCGSSSSSSNSNDNSSSSSSRSSSSSSSSGSSGSSSNSSSNSNSSSSSSSRLPRTREDNRRLLSPVTTLSTHPVSNTRVPPFATQLVKFTAQVGALPLTIIMIIMIIIIMIIITRKIITIIIIMIINIIRVLGRTSPYKVLWSRIL